MDHALMLSLVEETNKPDDYSDFSQEELAALSIMDMLKSSYRKDAFDRAGLGKYDLTNPIMKSLIKKGLVKVGPGGGSGFGSLTPDKALSKAVMKRYYAPPKFKGDLENTQLRFMRKPQTEAAKISKWTMRALTKFARKMSNKHGQSDRMDNLFAAAMSGDTSPESLRLIAAAEENGDLDAGFFDDIDEAATVIRAGFAGHPEVQAALKLLKKLANATEAGLTSAQQKTLALASVILSNLGVDVVQVESLDEGLTDYDWDELDKEQLLALIDVVNKLMMATKDDKQKAILKKAMAMFAKARATAA